MGVSIAVETIGFKRAAVIFEQMGRTAGDSIPFWEEEVIPDMERIEYQLFKSQGRRGGGSWKFLSPETIQSKVRKNESPLINVASGKMLTALSEGYGYVDKPEGAIREVTSTHLRFGARVPGASESQRHRPIIQFTPFDTARWARWWVRYVIRIGQVAGAGAVTRD